MHKSAIHVVITTRNRPNLLKVRSFRSVCYQTRKPDYVWVVDDSDTEYHQTNQEILTSASLNTNIEYCINERSRGYAGALNTAITKIHSINKQAWVAILDDDDCWAPTHLENAEALVKPDVCAIVLGIETCLDDTTLPLVPTETMDSNSFLRGNPGWEGSNTFIKVNALAKVGFFDESLCCTHDRDLAVRLLALSEFNLVIAPHCVTVTHFIEKKRSQLSTSAKKRYGLVHFLRKHRWRMDRCVYNAFLERAEQLFALTGGDLWQGALSYKKKMGGAIIMYNSESVFKKKYVITMPLKGGTDSLEKALRSFVSQSHNHEAALFILDQEPNPNWRIKYESLLAHPSIVLTNVVCQSIPHARTVALELAKSTFHSANWFCRLDPDDELAHEHSLRDAIIVLGKSDRSDRWALFSNLQSIGDIEVENLNSPNKNIICWTILEDRLSKMTKGDVTAELPSCNLFIHRLTKAVYPNIPSGEDHFLLAMLIYRFPKEGVVAGDVIWAKYSINGNATLTAVRHSQYFDSRLLLLRSFKFWTRSERVHSHKVVLGWGQEGTVFLEGKTVQKVFFPRTLSEETINELDDIFTNNEHFPTVKWSSEGQSTTATYNYSKLSSIRDVEFENVKGFLIKALVQGWVVLDYSVHNAGSRKGSVFYFDIGHDIRRLRASYFRDMCARAYCIHVLKWTDSVLREKRQTFRGNEENLSKLPRFTSFYDSVITSSMRLYLKNKNKTIIHRKKSINDVTLLIKTCALDSSIIRFQLGHILESLKHNYNYKEVVVAVDPFNGPFLREYGKPSLDDVYRIIDDYVRRGYIDRVVVSPNNDPEQIQQLYQRWFMVDSLETHSAKGVPIFPQLWAFEQVKTRFVLQCDLDCMISLGADSEGWLEQMHDAIHAEDVMSVGFKTAPNPHHDTMEYSAPAGRHVPEVRFALLDLMKIMTLRPFPNELDSGKLTLSWYRSIEQFQKRTKYRSLRGGSSSVFYINPPNKYKSDLKFYGMCQDLIVQGKLPTVQFGHWDLQGTYMDWQYQARYEEIIVVILGYQCGARKAKRCLDSLFGQSYKAWGAIIVDDGSDPVFQNWLTRKALPYKSQVTLINHKEKRGRTCNLVEYTRALCRNPESLLFILDMDDCLIKGDVLEKFYSHYRSGADLIVGRMYRPDKPIKLYDVDFKNIRNPSIGNAWVHPKAYRTKLFNCITDGHFKDGDAWIDYCEDFASMAPIAELAKHPVFIDDYMYFHQRSTEETPAIRKRKNDLIGKTLVDLEAWSPPCSQRTRHYHPNIKRIEIDITYRCDLHCPGCNRSCTQKPNEMDITLTQIENFIQDSETRSHTW